jgi:hypothetical protein
MRRNGHATTEQIADVAFQRAAESVDDLKLGVLRAAF